MKYSYTAKTVDWTGPNHENKEFGLEEKDMYGIKRLWNVTDYTNNGHLNPKLPHAKRLQIVGDEKGQFYLQVENISLYDAGLYRCQMIINESVIMETFIIQINQNNIQSIPSHSRIVVENMDITLVTEVQHLAITNNDDNTSKSASSDNDSNTLENLNDGYEHPYTTLMINNRTEDEHVYLPSRKNASNEHSTVFENAACKLSFALTELNSTHDITKTHCCQNEVHENENSNDLKDSISRSNVFSQTNIPEYINLSLKQ
ncbi:unnamed protein product [Mytilus coruscus]|uniref:Immunoglobulin V-set domain-containing protein n=1 Tax=Mytilus coruscus TaxID=42192 RepID=A0A6J8AHS9_MYTCO|nr:unnamed protein product [Mytilus coruscus]